MAGFSARRSSARWSFEQFHSLARFLLVLGAHLGSLNFALSSIGQGQVFGGDACDRMPREGCFAWDWLAEEPCPLCKDCQESGITFTSNLTNFYIGNTAGGLERDFRFSGHGDYRVNFDINKLGGLPGQFLQLRAEHRYGESMAGTTGALLPPNLAADLPVVESEKLYLTNVIFTQAFSESFAVFAGKIDTLDGDLNAFAHGRGINQFSNAAFVVNPIGLRTVAYSTLAAGFVVLQDLEPAFTFTVLNASDTANTSGFSELFEDGVVLSNELRLPTNFFGKPGHQLVGAIWSSKEFVALNQSPLIILPNVPIARESGSWAVTYNFDQYLFTERQDHTKGWGVFGRAGLADPNTNPIQYFLSLGIGGNSQLRGRDQDTFGLGWYYYGISDELVPSLSAALGSVSDGQGAELFYNIAMTRRLFVTADAQVIDPARTRVDTSLLVGLRVNLAF